MSVPYDDIDPGIREVVRWVNSLGFETTDSGDGVSKLGTMECALDVPHVHIIELDVVAAVRIADALYAAVITRGIVLDSMRGPSIQLSYDPADSTSVVSLYGVDDAMLAAAAVK